MLIEDYFSADLAKKIRKSILAVSHAKQSPHVGSCLSCVEILISAYGTKFKFRQNGNDNCKVVFSKGHANPSITLNVYGHVLKDSMGSIQRALDESYADMSSGDPSDSHRLSSAS